MEEQIRLKSGDNLFKFPKDDAWWESYNEKRPHFAKVSNKYFHNAKKKLTRLDKIFKDIYLKEKALEVPLEVHTFLLHTNTFLFFI